MAFYLIDDIERFRKAIVGNVIVDVAFKASSAGPEDPDYWEMMELRLDSGYVIQFSSTFSEEFKRQRRTPGRPQGERRVRYH